MESTGQPVPVIAKGKIQDCVERARQAIENKQQAVILGKASSMSKAISIAEIIKR
jgi:hypothetical protein